MEAATHEKDSTETSDSHVPIDETLTVSKAKAVTVIVTLTGVSFLSTMGSGILIAVLPQIAKDVGISQVLILWPAAVYALAAGCLLLIVGPKLMWITGSFLYVVFTMAVGLSESSTQIILLQTLLGVAIAMCLPTAVSLITNTSRETRGATLPLQ